MSDLSDDAKVAEAIKAEIKRIGDDTKTLLDTMQRDLQAARKLVEEGKGYTDAQVKALADTAVAKHEAFEAQVKALDARSKALDERAELLETALNRSPGGGDPNLDDEAKAAFKASAEFKRTVLSRRGELKVSTEVKAEQADVDALADYRKAFRSAVLLKDREHDMSLDEQKALRTGSDPDGGYLVPPAVSQRVLQRIYETSPIRQIATVETIGTDEMEIPVDDEEVGAGWVGEEEARPETGTPRVGRIVIRADELYAKPKATQRLLEDATRDVEAWLSAKIADKFSRLENTAFVIGNGVNKPRGFLTYPAGTARGQIQQLAGGHATELLPDAILKLPFTLREFWQPNARFVLKRSTMAAIALFKDSTGQYLWNQGLRDGAGAFNVAGYPVTFADDMPTVAAGTLPIAFGDFRAAYTILDRLGIRLLRDPYSAKPFVEFYARRRVGGAVVETDALVLLKISV